MLGTCHTYVTCDSNAISPVHVFTCDHMRVSAHVKLNVFVLRGQEEEKKNVQAFVNEQDRNVFLMSASMQFKLQAP